MQYLLILSLFILFPCYGQLYRVAIDPSWYPLEVPGREGDILAFSKELLAEIAKRGSIEIEGVLRNWNNLEQGLGEQYDAILSSMYPHRFYRKTYTFSTLYLPSGPVIILPYPTKIFGIDPLRGKIIGIVKGSAFTSRLQTYPILLRSYDSPIETFQALLRNEIDAAVIDTLSAHAYCKDLYEGLLYVVSPPLTEFGLRLITRYNQSSNLISVFDKGLKGMKGDGSYDRLLEKWHLPQELSPPSFSLTGWIMNLFGKKEPKIE